MKTKKKVLDVDFIGGQGVLTKEEERALSEFLRKSKMLRGKISLKKSKKVKEKEEK